jgi:DegV family protein with EDD domain
MGRLQIITDGGCDLPKHFAEKAGVTIVPLSVHFGSEQLSTNLDPDDFYDKMKAAKELPKTASPSPDDFYNFFKAVEENRDILVIALSSGLSSTYNHALMAKEMLLQDGFSGRVEIIDSRSASVGQGLLVYKAAKMDESNASMDEIVLNLQEAIEASGIYFILDNLENVIRGGRLDRVRGTVASILNIKLLMGATEAGTIEVLEKIRGTQNAIKRLINKVGEASHDLENGVLAVAHSNCEERARSIMEQLRSKYPFRDVLFANMGPVIGTYAGEGGIIVAY